MKNDIKAHILETFNAYQTEDAATLHNHFHPEVSGFDADGGFLKDGISIKELQKEFQQGLRHQLTVRHLNTTIYGETAVSTGYIEVETTLSNGVHKGHIWRFSDIRTKAKHDDHWKLIHYHFSRLG